MHVRLLCDRVNHRFLELEGEVVEVSTEEARALILSGQAEPIGSADSPLETAALAVAETAMRPKAIPTRRAR